MDAAGGEEDSGEEGGERRLHGQYHCGSPTTARVMPLRTDAFRLFFCFRIGCGFPMPSRSTADLPFFPPCLTWRFTTFLHSLRNFLFIARASAGGRLARIRLMSPQSGAPSPPRGTMPRFMNSIWIFMSFSVDLNCNLQNPGLVTWSEEGPSVHLVIYVAYHCGGPSLPIRPVSRRVVPFTEAGSTLVRSAWYRWVRTGSNRQLTG